MKRFLFVCYCLLIGSVLPSSAADKVPDSAAAQVQLLCKHITTAHRKLIVDTNGLQTAWSDGIILEAATNFAAPLEQMLQSPSNYYNLHANLRRLERAMDGSWKSATISPSANEKGWRTITATDRSVRVLANTLYVDYAMHRYPKAATFIKSKDDPILIRVGGKIRVVIMPIDPVLAK